MFELVITLILVIPVPRKIRNAIARQVFRWNLGEQLWKVGLFVGVALALALVESISSIQRLEQRERIEHEVLLGNPAVLHEHERIYHDLDKQRKFRAERNSYLAGFSLTLLFVIVRISQLMQEAVEYEEQVERLTNAVREGNGGGDDSIPQNAVEMTSLPTKKDAVEKKKD
jgi:hypothetical protein